MTSAKSPGAVAALGASVSDQLGRQVIPEITRHQRLTQVPIRAELIGSSRCEAEGLSVCGYAPVFAMCRELVGAGFHPACPLEHAQDSGTADGGRGLARPDPQSSCSLDR
jgi:hypothetical protein